MTLENQLQTSGASVPLEGVFERVERLRATRQKWRVVRTTVAGAMVTAAVGVAATSVITSSDGDEHRIVATQSTTSGTSGLRPTPNVSSLQPMSAADSAAVSKVVGKFFSPTATPAQREEILEHGPELRSSLDSMAQLPGGMPFGPWSAPEITVQGHVGNTAIVDVTLNRSENLPMSTTTSQGSDVRDSLSPLVAQPTLRTVHVVQTNAGWKLAAAAFCSLIDGVAGGKAKPCDPVLETNARVQPGEAQFGSLDEQSGYLLRPEVVSSLAGPDRVRRVVLGASVLLPGVPGFFGLTAEISVKGQPLAFTGISHFADDGSLLKRISLDGTATELVADLSVDPPVLWAKVSPTREGANRSDVQLVRVSRDLAAVTAQVPFPLIARHRVLTPDDVVEPWLPVGDTISVVDRIYESSASGRGPVDLATFNLDGNEASRVRLLDDAIDGTAAPAPGTESDDPRWGVTSMSVAREGAQPTKVIVSDGSQIWIVDTSGSTAATSERRADRTISSMLFSSKLLLVSADRDAEGTSQPRQHLETVDLATGVRTDLFTPSVQGSCRTLSQTSDSTRIWWPCGGFDLGNSASTDRSDSAQQTADAVRNLQIGGSGAEFDYEIDVPSGTVARTLILTGSAGFKMLISGQHDPNYAWFKTAYGDLMRVELPAER